MSNLGTLWFGADIDLSALKQKINQGNQSILDALKMNYDPQSYQQMVTKLRTQLDNEVFKIRISTDTSSVRQNLQSTLNGIGNGISAPSLNLGQLKGIPRMTSDLAELKDTIFTTSRAVASLKQGWKDMVKVHGKQSQQAKDAFEDYKRANNTLQYMRLQYSMLQKNRTQATVAQQQLNREQKEAARIARQWNSDSMRLNTTLAGGVHISTQLGSALSTVFALDYARQFLGNVIEIGGQLEKQRISIGAILGDTVKATHLFEQIKGLALKSPFGVVELDQYTKQLSAYGFKYNELFDMTKRLADISAGAGTDIGRLTLALGHVRSATYLTGITLRQFSMNNIPMLKMLADYYTEVEKKAVSTAEVQQRISKRQVSYEDVIEQIRRLTNEGGMFYNMQEKISESLAAKFKNLKDAMDIMYGEMAEGTIGDMLKGLASALLQTTRHWREIGNVLGLAAAAFMANKIAIGLSNVTMKANTSATLRQIMADKQLTANNLKASASYRALSFEERRKILTARQLTAQDVQLALATNKLTEDEVLNAIALKKMTAAEAQALVNMKLFTQAEIDAAMGANVLQTRLATLGTKLKNTFSGIGTGTWLTLGAMVGMELYSAYSTWVDRIDDKSKEMTDLIKSRVLDLEKMQKKLNENPKSADKTALKGQVEDMRQVLANSEAYTKSLDEQLSKTGDLGTKYDILSKAIGDAVEKNKKALDYQTDIAEMVKASSIGAVDGLFSHGLTEFPLFNYFFNDDISQNMKQTLESYKDLRMVIDNAWEYKDAIKGVIEEMEKSGKFSDEFAERLKNAPFEEQIRLLAESKYWDEIVGQIIATDVNFTNFAGKLKDASNGVTSRWEEIFNDDVPKMMKKAAKQRGIEEKEFNQWCLDNIDDFKMMLEGLADQLDLKEPEIRRGLKRIFYDYIRLSTLAEQMNGNEGMAAGALAGASIGNAVDAKLKKLLEEDENADIKDNDTTNPTDKSKKDKTLEAWKDRYDALKAYYDEVQKYVKLGYDVKSAMQKVKELGLGDGDVFKGLEASRENYARLLRELLNETNADTTQRAKFQRTIKSALGDYDRDGTKEIMDKNVSIMKDYIQQMDSQWKLYRSLLTKSGGNRAFASSAFNDGVIWDEVSKKMLEEFNTKSQEKGVIPINFSWRMNKDEMENALRDTKGNVQKDLVDLAQEIQKIVRANYTKFLEDTASAYEKSLTAAEKLAELERQRQELIDSRNSDNNQTQEQRDKWNTQIAAKDKEIANQKWAAFKETEEWGRIFANLDNISTSTLQNMLAKLRAIVPQLQISEEATKSLYEAMDKMQSKIIERNPFAAISNSISNASRLRYYRSQANKIGDDILANTELSKLLNVKLGSKVTKEQLDDAIKQTEGDIPDGLTKLGNDFKALQDVIQPVIDLFDQLGMTDLSEFFGMANNALSAAANTASGLSALGLGNLGPYGAAASAALSVVSSFIAIHDESLQAEIEASERRQKEMENLTKNLERVLERTIGGIYNTRAAEEQINTLKEELKPTGWEKIASKITGFKYKSYLKEDTINAIKEAEKTKTYYDASYASLLAQRDELQHQMDDEEKKKKSDADRITDYKQQLVELDDEIKYFAEDMAKALYDIDFKSWAQDLASALVDAWATGENAAKAYQKKVSEILKELGVKMIAERFVAQALEPIMNDFIKQYETDNGVLTKEGMAILGRMYDAGTELSKQTNDFMDGLNEIAKQRGIDMKDASDSSSMSASIKGITENTADLLASYLNAMRLDLSVIRSIDAAYYPQIVNVLSQGNVLAQSQVTLQTQIAANTLRNADAAEKIYNLFRSVAPDGTGIKVK